MSKSTRIDYDQLTQITKRFKDDGEQIVQLHSSTRQKLEALHSEWVGTAADRFFNEMEGKLLPAIQRLNRALLLSENVLTGIMKTIHEADTETAGYFNRLDGAGAGINIGPAGGASEQFIKWDSSGDAVNQFPKVESAAGAVNQFEKLAGSAGADSQFPKVESAAGAVNQFEKLAGSAEADSQFIKVEGTAGAVNQFEKLAGSAGADSQFPKVEGAPGTSEHYMKH